MKSDSFVMFPTAALSLQLRKKKLWGGTNPKHNETKHLNTEKKNHEKQAKCTNV